MDDLDSLLARGDTHSKKTILLVAACTAIVLIGTGISLLTARSIDLPLSTTPEALPPFDPKLSTASSSSTVQKINLNTADRDTLLELPGIGEVRADTLIQYRPYVSFDDLRTKTKLPFSVVDKMTDYVSF